MLVLPYRKFSIATPLIPTEVLTRIRESLEPERGLVEQWTRSFSRPPHQPFLGRVTGNRFDITRFLDYRNSFSPRVWGVVETTPGGTRLTARMGLDPVAAVFIAAFLLMTGQFALVVIADAWARGAIETSIPLMMFAGGVALALGAFAFEAPRTFRALADVVDAPRP